MNQQDIVSRWHNFLGNYEDAWTNTKVYWAAEHARAWDINVHGKPVDPTVNYVWLHKIPNHARITFSIVSGFNLDGKDAGLYHINDLYPIINQAYLEY